jgi:hypothetical protein
VRRFLDARAERAAGRARAKRTKGLARRASAANATNESGGEAEIAGGVGMRRGAATRSLRSARGAAHSAAPRHAVGGQEGYDHQSTERLGDGGIRKLYT